MKQTLKEAVIAEIKSQERDFSRQIPEGYNARIRSIELNDDGTGDLLITSDAPTSAYDKTFSFDQQEYDQIYSRLEKIPYIAKCLKFKQPKQVEKSKYFGE